MKVHKFTTDDVKCGFCNWKTQNHYLMGDTREEARELFEEDSGDLRPPRGFCADCLVECFLTKHDKYGVAGPDRTVVDTEALEKIARFVIEDPALDFGPTDLREAVNDLHEAIGSGDALVINEEEA